jgi:ABC-2 type transport system permease protein
VTLLWTISGEGLRRILPVLATVFSGMIVPLPLWPDWLRPIVLALPFAGISDLPFRLYMGHIPPEHLAWPLLHETLWTIGLVLLGRALLRTGLRRVVVQGG